MTTSRRLSFDNLHNTRDLGGMKTMDGYTVRSGCLFRSGNLHSLSDSDVQKLQEQVDTVIDFRSFSEREEEPDMALPGVRYLHLPVIDDFSSAGVTRDHSSQEALANDAQLDSEAARQLMVNMYTRFPHSEKGIDAYRTFLRVLLEDHEKAVLWHCSAGKDRAGLAAVIIERILGVSPEEIEQDYLATNDYQRDKLVYYKQLVQKQAGRDDISDDTIQYLFGADASYLQAFYDSVDERYGSFDRYLHEALSLSDEMIQTLRRRYLIQESE